MRHKEVINMTNREIALAKDFMKSNIFATKEEIMGFIFASNPDRNVSNSRFYLFDLVRANVIYKYDAKRYKYLGNLKQFSYQFTKSDLDIKKSIEERFDDIQLCIWNTSFLSKYVNLLPFDYYTFLEIDKSYLNLIFDFLKNDYHILYLPDQNDLDIYRTKSNQIILKKLLARAPLDKTYDNYIGVNKKNKSRKKVVFAPRIEKILVDIFVEADMYSVFSEIDEIFENILKEYAVNFQKLLYYAKNRNVEEKIREYIVGTIKYEIESGEFK